MENALANQEHTRPSSLRGAQRRGNPERRASGSGLLRFARNDEGCWDEGCWKVLIPFAALALAACTQERPVGFAATLPPPTPVEQTTAPANGAIFSTRIGYAPLHYGNRAARVGDIVQVVLIERTQAGKTTAASSDREGAINISPPALGPFSFDPGNLNSGSGASFNGSGDAAQSNTLRGDIAVTIAEVLPGGMARIRGEKLMRLSQGEEWIQLSGLIRLADVDADNRISSTRIADADIAYGGRGHIQRSSQPGWLSQFFTLVSPF